MIEFKKEAKEIVEYLNDNCLNTGLIELDEQKSAKYINTKILNILKDDDRYGKLLKANHEILLIIDELRNTIRKLRKQEELVLK